MKGDLLRWGVFGLCLLVLIGIQFGVKSFFFGDAKPDLTAHSVDVRAIGKVWEREVDVPKPDQLVRPIRGAFDAAAAPIGIDAGDDGDEEVTAATIPGGYEVLGVLWPHDPSGVPRVLIRTNTDRDIYTPGDELPNGQLLDSVEKGEAGEYLIRVHDPSTGTTTVVPFQGETP